MKEELRIKVFINNKYENIDVTVQQFKNNVVCSFNARGIGLPDKTIKGVATCLVDDEFDFNIGKRIAIKSFLINFYGFAKGRAQQLLSDITKRIKHERLFQTHLQNKLRASLRKISQEQEKKEGNELKVVIETEGITTFKTDDNQKLNVASSRPIKFCERCGEGVEIVNDGVKYIIVCECGRNLQSRNLDDVINMWNKAN